MAIIIDMQKPNSCNSCPFNVCDCYCKLNDSRIDRDDMTPDDGCPIVEIDKQSYEIDRIMNAYDNFIASDNSQKYNM